MTGWNGMGQNILNWDILGLNLNIKAKVIRIKFQTQTPPSSIRYQISVSSFVVVCPPHLRLPLPWSRSSRQIVAIWKINYYFGIPVTRRKIKNRNGNGQWIDLVLEWAINYSWHVHSIRTWSSAKRARLASIELCRIWPHKRQTQMQFAAVREDHARFHSLSTRLVLFLFGVAGCLTKRIIFWLVGRRQWHWGSRGGLEQNTWSGYVVHHLKRQTEWYSSRRRRWSEQLELWFNSITQR